MAAQDSKTGTLFIVATPIGNLSDITQRAISVLTEVDVIACEDTRHTKKLLSAFSITNKTLSLHDHNERQKQDYIAELLLAGNDVALVSDAGTPLISDPGFHLVRHCRQLGLKVSPIPGACAAIAALSVAGLPTDRFTFEGFLPSKSTARKKVFESIQNESRTVVFYDAPRRAIDTVSDIVEVLGPERHIVIARELTKAFETIHGDSAGNFLAWLQQDANQLKGEMVLIIEGLVKQENQLSESAISLLKLLLNELPPKKACAIVAQQYQLNKKTLYEYALSCK
ncbi:16S rRNA (cytidine(1402)-2'-O)-methyltransferase [Thalassotalea sp. G2M2-11]|uniref:16S rRNA (cytidine(1402)-2'-O)-methyltransferase n=1 Tax=Thalassotalea sp. G2M2-11 TaxID=2787627 RepID=UPI0019D0A34D|nr:16S rRNA (cytidine(1402)-2'-O)-methyltransferase [Thalassotalea sp. G2M2-11]